MTLVQRLRAHQCLRLPLQGSAGHAGSHGLLPVPGGRCSPSSRPATAAPVIAFADGIYAAVTKGITPGAAARPVAVFCLLFGMTARFGFALLPSLGWFVGAVLLGLLLQAGVVYSLALVLLARVSPLAFFRRIQPVAVTAFSTSSSNATLPTTLRVSEEALGIPKAVGDFVLTIGATANQNGTALFEGVTVLFLAQLAGVDLSLGQQIMVVYLAVLGGIGTAGVPSGSIPFVIAVLASVGREPGPHRRGAGGRSPAGHVPHRGQRDRRHGHGGLRGPLPGLAASGGPGAGDAGDAGRLGPRRIRSLGPPRVSGWTFGTGSVDLYLVASGGWILHWSPDMSHQFPLGSLPIPVAALLAVLATASPSGAQALGTVALNASLADAGVQVVGVMNKDPQSSQFLAFCEGPARDAQGNLFFTEQTPNRIWKVSTSGTGAVFGGSATYTSNGTEFDAQGRLTVCQKGAIATYDAAGARTVLATLDATVSANDITIGSTGAMYFSNWGSQVFHRSATGQVTAFDGYSTSNGIEWVEERKKLYLSQDGPDQVWVYDVADDGKLSNGKVFASIPEPDGITLDEKGNIYVASWNDGKIYAFDTTGHSLGTVTVKSANTGDNNQNGNTSNCVIGSDKKLYITGDGGLYSVQLKVGPRKQPGPVGLRAALRFDPRGLSLSSGAFNPAYQSLSIALPVAGGRFAVRIYDVRMREVWNAAAGDAAGFAALEWNGASASGEPLPSGRYFILAQGAGARKPLSAPVDILRR